MKKNVIVKVLTLVFALLMVILASRYTDGPSFKDSLNALFGPAEKTFTWCPEHTTDFKWGNNSIASRMANKTPNELKKLLCSPTVEPIENLDLSTIAFQLLVTAQTSEAKTVELEWNPEHQVFRSQGMPFKSSRLSRDLLDESP